MLFHDNIGSRLSLDQTSLSNSELYTILTNKAVKGQKGCLVAMIKQEYFFPKNWQEEKHVNYTENSSINSQNLMGFSRASLSVD